MQANDDIFMLRYAHRLPSVWFLVCANFAAAGAVFLFGGLQQLTAVYWWELVFLSLFSCVRVVVVSPLLSLLILPGLLAGTGFALMVYTLVLSVLGSWPNKGNFPDLELVLLEPGVVFSFLPLFFSHCYSFFHNFWPKRASCRGANERYSLDKFTSYPFKRGATWVAFIVFSMLVGGISGEMWVSYLLMVVLKIAVDVWGHVELNELAAAAKSGS